MARKCQFGDQKELHDPRYFSVKRLSPDKGSYCSTCGVYVRDPTHKKFDDLLIASTNEGNLEHYYNVEGKQVEVQILLPVREVAWRTKKGDLIKMENEIVHTIQCRCCHSDCRGGSYSKTDKRKAKEKEEITLMGDKPGLYPTARQIKYIKPELADRLKPLPNSRRGRKKGIENRIPSLMKKINPWLKDEYMSSILQQYNEVGFDYHVSNEKDFIMGPIPLDEIIDIFKGSAQGSEEWKEFKEISSDDIARCKKIIIKKLKEYAKKNKVKITRNETREETSYVT